MQMLAQSAFLKALGWSLLNSLWQMSFLWLVYFVINFSSKKITANAKHNLAVVLLCAGFGWFLFSFLNYYIQSENGVSFFTFSVMGDGNLPAIFFNNVKIFVEQALPYLTCVYLVVLAFQLSQYSKDYLASKRLMNDGLHKINADLRLFSQEIAYRLGINKKVKIYLSSLVDSPMTLGFFKYIILIPLATINNLSTQQIEAILLHELAHIKRNDYLLNLLMTIVEIIFFFNPFSRLFINVIKKERENSCDDLVMQFNYDPHLYVMALLSLEKSRHTAHQLAMAAIGKNNKLLLQRVKRITGQKHAQTPVKPKLFFFFFISIVLCGVVQFKVLQTTLQSTITKASNKNGLINTETQQPVFFSALSLMNNKSDNLPPRAKTKNKSAAVNKDDANVSEDDQTMPGEVSPDLAEDQQSTDNAVAVAQSQPVAMDFSIQTQKPNNIAEENIVQSQSDYPYVPSASFSYQAIQDTSLVKEFSVSPNDMGEGNSKTTTIKILTPNEWKKIEKEMKVNSKDIVINLHKINTELQKAVGTIDLEKINNEVVSSSSEQEANRIKNDIQVQVQALVSVKTNQSQSKKLFGEIKLNQLKLQQKFIQQQQEILKKLKETKRRSKVIYI